jgi:hypothetical protein
MMQYVRPKHLQVFATLHGFATSGGFVGWCSEWYIKIHDVCTFVQTTNQHKPFFSTLCVVLCGMHCERLLKRQGAETVTNPLEAEAFKISAGTVVTNI